MVDKSVNESESWGEQCGGDTDYVDRLLCDAQSATRLLSHFRGQQRVTVICHSFTVLSVASALSQMC